MKTYREKHIENLYKKFVMHTYSPEIVLEKGKGSFVWDVNGHKYLDFTSGIGVCSLGHCPAELTDVISRQSAKLVHVSNLFMNEHQPRLAEKLVSRGFDGVAFFANSGAEANEGMIKFARKYGEAEGRHEIIVMDDSFHGRTLATLAATGRPKYRKGFAPDMQGFVSVPFNDFKSIEKAANKKTVAVMLEPIQGEGGVVPADKEYLQKVREFCDEKGILLLFDEVQCGIGRTGFFYAYQGYGVKPDAISLAKALGNGFPIGAFIVKRYLENVLGLGSHASTFGGTPLASAAASAVIDSIHEKNILANCMKQGFYLQNKIKELIKKYNFVKSFRGRGLMLGIILDIPVNDILPKLKKNGLLALPAGENVLRFLPPLTIKKEEIDTAFSILVKTFDNLSN